MPAPLFHIATSQSLPSSADVVVIGGGIVGTCTAYYLALRGVKVALVEKGRIGAEQSSRNWGWCRQQNRDARELPMATRSLALWDTMAAEIGLDLGFRRSGLLYLSNDEAEIADWAQWRDFARGEGVFTQVLSASEATARAQTRAARPRPRHGLVPTPECGPRPGRAADQPSTAAVPRACPAGSSRGLPMLPPSRESLTPEAPSTGPLPRRTLRPRGRLT